ncbi:hypothetical protein [Deinococcus puniceus]|uniref:Uncharacterized protein n=1 Tax=Deinococcus puniceus TaxID=1182568 RepID=A0A172TC10_9DEIO|nr:hypothetical protein [Deinococcus puniceus]ANE44457.1 hypothetical protein SU48_12580 [Deinococcus puniceus]
MTARVWGIAALAAALWFIIGLVQRTRAGAALTDAALAELPFTVVVFGIAVIWVMLRQSRGK